MTRRRKIDRISGTMIGNAQSTARATRVEYRPGRPGRRGDPRATWRIPYGRAWWKR